MTSTTSSILNYNFTKAVALEFPENLTALDLEPLSHVYSSGLNVTVTTGAAASDVLMPVALENSSSTPLIALNYSQAFIVETPLIPSNLPAETVCPIV